MSTKKRIFALFVACAMVFAMAFSAFFIAHNAEHKCSGSDCRICEQISICLKSMNEISPKPESAAAVMPLMFALVMVIGVCVQFNKKSLVDLNIKLSN
jgi:hypothetical protein